MSRKFILDREINFINEINRELIQSVVSQEVFYYEISVEKTQTHRLYNEAIRKFWNNPLKIAARVLYLNDKESSTVFGQDQVYSLEVYFHNKELEERKISPKNGDFLEYGNIFYEITSVTEPQIVFGQINNKLMKKCMCIISRESNFSAGSITEENKDTTHVIEQNKAGDFRR